MLRAFLRVRALLRMLMVTPFLPPARPLTYFGTDRGPHRGTDYGPHRGTTTHATAEPTRWRHPLRPVTGYRVPLGLVQLGLSFNYPRT